MVSQRKRRIFGQSGATVQFWFQPRRVRFARYVELLAQAFAQFRSAQLLRGRLKGQHPRPHFQPPSSVGPFHIFTTCTERLILYIEQIVDYTCFCLFYYYFCFVVCFCLSLFFFKFLNFTIFKKFYFSVIVLYSSIVIIIGIFCPLVFEV